MEFFSGPRQGRLLAWKVKVGGFVKKGQLILDYTEEDEEGKTKTVVKYRSASSGVVVTLVPKKGDVLTDGSVLMTLGACSHPTVITDLCAVCGVDFRGMEDDAKPTGTSVSMIHTVPDLKCSLKEAQEISLKEETRLLKQRKLHLLVDLDQTLIHTTNMDVPSFVTDVFHFRLPGSPLTYHTRLRPGTRPFLQKISSLYELHICTFGSRNYAHSIARHLDPDGKYFYIRILSRDECFSQNSKTANLQELFPSGDHMVCIIDDREDVWNFTPNLIHVKPYHFFSKTGDINAPPSLSKKEDDNKTGFEFSGGEVKQLSTVGNTNAESDLTTENVANVEAEQKSTDVLPKKDVSKDLRLTDDDTTARDSSSSSSAEAEVSTPKPDVPQVFEEENPLESTADKLQHEHSDSPQPIPPTLEEKKDEQKEDFLLADTDDYLMYLEDILERIHAEFYKEYDALQESGITKVPSVKQILPALRKNVLKGCSIVFSGVVPMGAKLEQSRAYGVAVSLGARVTDKIIPPRKSTQPSTSKEIPPTTHIVAARLGTAKTNEARRHKGLHIVTPDWLWCCAERWDRVDERLFAICKKSTIRRNPPSHLPSERESEGSEQNHEDEDDAFLSSTYSKQPTGGDGENGVPGSRRVRTLSGRFMDTINPLLSFSMDEIASMDHEVDDILSGSSSSSNPDESPPSKRQKILRRKRSQTSSTERKEEFRDTGSRKSSSESSASGDDENPAKRLKRRRDLPPTETDEPEEEESLVAKFRRGEPLPSDAEILNLTNQTSDDENDAENDQENEWMARQLEAELLGADSSRDTS